MSVSPSEPPRAESDAAQAPVRAPLVAESAWARQPAPSRDVTAVYATLTNQTAEPVRIVSGRSGRARSVELHEMVMEDALMRMRRVPEIVVPAKGQVELKPGGLHLMLLGLASPLNIGDTIPITLTPEDRVLLVGDVRQHEAVDAGRPYHQLQGAGIHTAQLNEIVRQRDLELKAAVEKLSRGDVHGAVERLDHQGRVHEIGPREERLTEIANEYVKDPHATFVVSPDN